MNKNILTMTVFVLCLFAASAIAQDARFDPMSLNLRLGPVRGMPEWRWTPDMNFNIFGPLSGSSEVTVEYTLPTGKAFVKTKCWTEKTEANETMNVRDCGNDLERETATNLTGIFGFQIKLADELNGINKVLYSGKFTVNKYSYNPAKIAANAKNFYYFVEYDWRLPYAYIGIRKAQYRKTLSCDVWLKADTTSPEAKAYLMFNSKPVAEASQSGSLQYDLEDNDAQEFTRMEFDFNALTESPESPLEGFWRLDQNPGEYEIKVLRRGQLARTMKFSIGKDGKFVDNGVVRQNKLGDNGILVAAQIVGDSDGKINRLAFKEGIWGNPIAGFTPPQ
jgi:hypothetical protein